MHVADFWQRAVLRRAALRYADHGWPVVPGAALTGDRYVCGPLCPTVACHPAIEAWERLASVTESTVDCWWQTRPYSVLLATGRSFDVLEVPARLGESAARLHRPGPVAVTPDGRWMFFVRPGESLRPELAVRPGVILHGRRSWIPAPPTRTPEGRVRWKVGPDHSSWQLPDPYAVQRLLFAGLSQVGPSPTFASSTPALHRVA